MQVSHVNIQHFHLWSEKTVGLCRTINMKRRALQQPATYNSAIMFALCFLLAFEVRQFMLLMY